MASGFSESARASPDLSEEIVSLVPHFHVVGIQAYKQKDK